VTARSAYTVHRPVANEYLVRERDRRRLRDLLKVLLVLAPVALALGAFTWVHLQVLDAGYRIEELGLRQHELGREESRLRLEAAYLAGPQVVEKRAAEDLGMHPPSLGQLVFQEDLPAPDRSRIRTKEPTSEPGAGWGARVGEGTRAGGPTR